MRGFFVFIHTIFASMKLHCRYSPIRAVAALLFYGILVSSGNAQDLDSLVDSGASDPSPQDTLRPRPDRVQVWHSGSFLVSQAALDRVISVPLESGRVPVSALGSASWDFTAGLIGDSWVSAIQSPFGLGHRLLRGDFDHCLPFTNLVDHPASLSALCAHSCWWNCLPPCEK